MCHMACEKIKSSNKRSFTRHLFQMLKNKYFTEPHDNIGRFISHKVPILELIKTQTLYNTYLL